MSLTDQDNLFHLQSIAMESAANGMIITDRNGDILWCNAAYLHMTGYTYEEVVGQNPRLFQSRQQDPAFYQQMWRNILAGKTWRGQLTDRHKDGSLFIVEQTITPVHDETGEIGFFIAITEDITRRQEAEITLQHNQALINQVLDILPVGVLILDANGNILRGNRAGQQIWSGIQDKENEPYNPYKGWWSATDSLIRPVEDLLTGALTRGEASFDREISISDLTGISKYISNSVVPIHNEHNTITGAIIVNQDITERKRAEEIIRQNAARALALAETMEALSESSLNEQAILQIISRSAAFFIGDLCLIHLISEDSSWLNPAAYYHPRLEVYEYVGTTFSEFRHEVDYGITGRVFQTGHPVMMQSLESADLPAILSPACYTYHEKYGISSILVVPLRLQNATIGTITLIKDAGGNAYTSDDLTFLQTMAFRTGLAMNNARLYHELKVSLEHEQQLRDRLIQTEKYAAIGRMMASITHEINNPVQIIKNYLYVSRQDTPAESPVQEYLEIISSETERIANLVAQLREIYRPRKVDQAQPVNLVHLLSEVRALLLPHLQGERIKWSSNIQDDQLYSPIIVEAVQDELKQVFLNIGLNAIQSMQSQGGTLFVEINLEDDRVGVSFRDTGPGISKKDLGSLFEPFYTTKADGLGLGLPICYDIVQRHGGQISVASHPGEGATFTVWLPLKPE